MAQPIQGGVDVVVGLNVTELTLFDVAVEFHRRSTFRHVPSYEEGAEAVAPTPSSLTRPKAFVHSLTGR